MLPAHGTYRCAILLCCVLLASAASADGLPERDNGPLTGLYGLPGARENARLLEPGRQALSLTALTSSHAVQAASGDESLLFDGETTRLTLAWRRAVSSRLELGIELPWVLHQSGGLDRLIDRWHSVFGLPDGVRAELPADRLAFRYYRAGAEALVLEDNTAGIGDVRLTAAWQLAAGPSSAHALRVGVKLPTGDPAKLTGSGAADLGIGIAGERRALWGLEGLRGYWQASATLLGRPDDLPLAREPLVGQLVAGVGWQLTPRFELAAQSRLRSPVYDSRISPPGGIAASLSVGAAFRLSSSFRLALGVTEDVKVESLPDVTFALGLTWYGEPSASGL